MTDFILHHYDNSPFAEKIRTLLGYKNASYQTVTIPVIMPKPDLVALTGGYRKTPVLQQGKHIYCDTRLMSRVIDEQLSEASIYPPALALTSNTIAQWADQQLFSIAVALTFSPAGFEAFSQRVPAKFVEAFLNDRAKMREGSNGLSMDAATAFELIPIYLQQLEQQLVNAGPFITGEQCTIADFSIYHCLWFINNNAGVRHFLTKYENLQHWLSKMKAIGHGTPTTIDAETAISIARSQKPTVFSTKNFEAINDFNMGDKVIIQPTDYGIAPVSGELVISKIDEIAVKRIDERAGEVYVHFPRVGYKIMAQ